MQGSPIPLTGNLLRLFTFLFSHNDQSVVDGPGPLWRAARAYADGDLPHPLASILQLRHPTCRF